MIRAIWLSALSEYHHLLTVLHLSLRIHFHTVDLRLIAQAFLLFCHVHHVPVREFLELLIVDVCPVHGDNFLVLIVCGGQHE